MNWLKVLMLLMLLILANQKSWLRHINWRNYKKTNHDKYFTSNDFGKLSGTISDEKLNQAKSSTKTDIAKFITSTYIDDKLESTNKNVTSHKTKKRN